MDRYGIGKALQQASENVFIGMRRTGRTTRMIQDYRPGDVAVFLSRRAAENFTKMAAKAGKTEIQTIVCSPTQSGLNEAARPRKQRLILDHEWVEEFYKKHLEEAAGTLNKMERGE
jgi:hypothetical protein